MDQRQDQLRVRHATVSAFGDLAAVMRSAAAACMRRAQALLAGVDAYTSTVEDAMAQARGLVPDDAPPRPASVAGDVVFVVIGAEQGFTGGMDARVLDACAGCAGRRVLMLGTHLLRLAQARGLAPAWSAPAVAHADAAPEAGRTLHEALGREIGRRPASEVFLVAPEVVAAPEGAQVAIAHRRLLPLELPAAAVARGGPPLLHLPAAQLLDELAIEFVAARLVRAILHAHAAESLARQQAMAAATQNVDRMLQALSIEETRLRQEEITAEIIELAGSLRDGGSTGQAR